MGFLDRASPNNPAVDQDKSNARIVTVYGSINGSAVCGR